MKKDLVGIRSNQSCTSNIISVIHGIIWNYKKHQTPIESSFAYSVFFFFPDNMFLLKSTKHMAIYNKYIKCERNREMRIVDLMEKYENGGR